MNTLFDKIKNNEDKLPWDDGYMPLTKRESILVINKAMEKLGNNLHFTKIISKPNGSGDEK